ncbi:MAG: type VI secretion system tube protein Hcp [Gammaproteobacteria bacterium]|nr:MAG: type VI secretion system tube protein Hcp [Gammaproteobacteria bacterium]
MKPPVHRALQQIFFAFLLLITSQAAVAAVSIFLNIPGIPGESVDAAHIDEIDILSWGQSASNVNTGPVLLPLTVSKYTDKASPLLTQHVLEGTRIPEMWIIVRSAGLVPLEYLTVKLCDANVISIKTGGSAADARLKETVTFSAVGYRMTYTPLRPDGSPDIPISYSYGGC